MTQKILAVGAHPDDIELGCGGTLVKHLEAGDDVFVLVMTHGERGSHAPVKIECLSSLKKIGIKEKNIFFGNFPDAYLTDNFETVNFIEGLINRLGITRVYTHHFNDRHQDHRNCSNAVSSAARKVPEIFLFQGPSTKASFEPHYFIELLEKHFQKKLESLNSYETQINKGIINLEWVKNISQVNGLLNGKKYVEAFAINHVLRGAKDV
jgi:LmbE family N-acetylglucosaminyl deacetylase